jgi:hypothetical protein
MPVRASSEDGRNRHGSRSRTTRPHLAQAVRWLGIQGCAHRVDPFTGVDLLELQARMARVLSKELVRLPRGLTDGFGKLVVRRPEARGAARIHRVSGSMSVVRPAVRSARPSAASLLSASCEAPNFRVHCSSSTSSSSSHRPTRSCSSGGRAASLAIAASRVRVMTASIPDARR